MLFSVFFNLWEERAGEESLLDLVRCDGRPRADPGGGPGDGAAGGWGYCGDGRVKNFFFSRTSRGDLQFFIKSSNHWIDYVQ